MTRPKDEMESQIVSSESDISHPILVYLSRNNNSQAQARLFPALTALEPEFPVIFGSKWDPLTGAWRQGGASPERHAELPTGVSLQKRIWKWDFYHCSSCNFFFHIWFCHLWCELPLQTNVLLFAASVNFCDGHFYQVSGKNAMTTILWSEQLNDFGEGLWGVYVWFFLVCWECALGFVRCWECIRFCSLFFVAGNFER